MSQASGSVGVNTINPTILHLLPASQPSLDQSSEIEAPPTPGLSTNLHYTLDFDCHRPRLYSSIYIYPYTHTASPTITPPPHVPTITYTSYPNRQLAEHNIPRPPDTPRTYSSKAQPPKLPKTLLVDEELGNHHAAIQAYLSRITTTKSFNTNTTHTCCFELTK